MDQPQFSRDFLSPNSRAYIGRYRLVARLGSGGMADVYLAMASGMVGFTKFSVIKVLKPDNAYDPEHVTMFLDEARLAAKLNHPNVVQTNEVGEDQGLYYLVMEYLEGQTLRRVLQLGRDDHERRLLPFFLHVISDMLAGLHHAHELCDYDGRHLGVVHRDVSPHNVFVTYEGQAKVVDFGIAKVIGAEHMTRTGMLKGKIAYMAPEQARARNVDRRADLFSTGVVLWEALARRRMWEGEADFSVLQKLAAGEVASIREHAPGLPEELYRLCERALAADPNARFSTAQEMREAIELFMNTQNWRVTSSDIGALMAGRFSNDRASIRALVESAVAAGSVSHAGLPWLLNTNPGNSEHQHHSDMSLRPSLNQLSNPSGHLPSGHFPSGRFPSTDSASLTGNFHLSTGAARPPSRARSVVRWLLPALASALVSGVAGFWALKRRNDVVTAAVVAKPVAAAPPVESALPPASIELNVHVTPAEASIYLDDKPLKGNPFHGAFPREGKHELRVEAPGYQSVKQTVSFQQDVSVELSLVRHAPTPTPPRVVVVSPPSRPRPPTSRPPSAPADSSFELPSTPGKRPVQPIDPDSPYLTIRLARGAPRVRRRRGGPESAPRLVVRRPAGPDGGEGRRAAIARVPPRPRRERQSRAEKDPRRFPQEGLAR